MGREREVPFLLRKLVGPEPPKTSHDLLTSVLGKEYGVAASFLLIFLSALRYPAITVNAWRGKNIVNKEQALFWKKIKK